MSDVYSKLPPGMKSIKDEIPEARQATNDLLLTLPKGDVGRELLWNSHNRLLAFERIFKSIFNATMHNMVPSLFQPDSGESNEQKAFSDEQKAYAILTVKNYRKSLKQLEDFPPQDISRIRGLPENVLERLSLNADLLTRAEEMIRQALAQKVMLGGRPKDSSALVIHKRAVSSLRQDMPRYRDWLRDAA